MKAAIAAGGAGGGASFVDHGIQQGIPAAAYNMYGWVHSIGPLYLDLYSFSVLAGVARAC